MSFKLRICAKLHDALFFENFDSYPQGSWNNILRLTVKLTEVTFFNREINQD